MGRRSRLVNACVKQTTNERHDDGPFIDYMFREVARRGLLRDEEAVANFTADPLSFVRRILTSDYAAQATADQTLVREQLIWRMTHVLRGDHSPSASNHWKVVQEVYRVLRAARLLRTRVSLHLLQKNIQETIDRKEARKQAETTFNRHSRLKDFWPQFHNSSRLGTPLDVKSFTASDVALPALVPSHLGKSKASKASKSLKDLEWKTRGARSHCSAGSWNWLPALPEPPLNTVKDGVARSASTSKISQDPKQDTASKDMRGLTTYVRDKGEMFPKLIPDTATTLPTSLLPSIQANPKESVLLYKGKFQRPWQVGQLAKQSLSTKQYLSACNREGLLPSTDPFVTGHSDCINAKAQGLSDRDLLAICEMLDTGSPVRELDLEGNASISEKAFLHLFTYFQDSTTDAQRERPRNRNLQKLSLAGCPNLVQDEPFAGLIQLLNSASMQNLLSLNLAGLAIGVNWQVPLCKAIRNHRSLKTLSLADTGLGTRSSSDEDDNTMICIVELLSSRSILHLDLSWNCFGALGFDFLGQKLIELGTLEKLDLASCSTLSKKSPWSSSMVYLLEHLSENTSLQLLNISGNYLDFRAALLLEDSLENNTVLREMDVSHNGLGNLGIRSLLRLLARKTSGLQYFHFENCSKGTVVGARTDLQIFRASRPQGRYKFDLAQPYHRTLLRMLYKTAERLNVAFDQTFRDMTASPPYSHASKNSSGIYSLPQAGTLELTFTMDKVLEDRAALAKGSSDSLEFNSVLTCHAQLLRILPGRSKQVALLAQWRRMEGLREEQSIMIDALSKDFRLSFAQIAVMCQDRAQIWDVMASLQCTPLESPLQAYLGMRLIPNSCDYVRMLQRSARQFSFNADNPTGHYSLDMSNPVDYGVAESLAILDNWEGILRIKEGGTDTSQLGNNSHARNIQHANCPLPCSLTDWILAESDVLELDYNSSRRPKGAEPVKDDQFELIMTALLQFARSPSRCRLQALLQISHTLYLTCLQLRQILDLFKDSTTRCDAFAMFYNRIVDIQFEKLVRMRLDDDASTSMLQRLGYAASFPYLQPEQIHIQLSCKNFDERLLVSSLLKLSGKESPSNLKDPLYTSGEGAVDPLTLGIPKSWEQMSNVPKHGVFEAEYVCRADQRSFKMRKDLLEQMGSWQTEIGEEDVFFCSFTSKLPADVLLLTTWMIANCDTLAAAFAQMRQDKDKDADGQMSSREFEEGCKRIGFARFKGPGEQQRFQTVFRFIDIRSEGKISLKDWDALRYVEQDLKVCIGETMLFCRRLFGDVESSWAALSDGTATMTLEEWQEAWDTLGYFGPIAQIFAFLDKDGSGSCSSTAFEQLSKYEVSLQDMLGAAKQEP
eukprot:s2650_g4.t1